MCPDKKWRPKQNKFNKNLSDLSEILDAITVNQVKKNDVLVWKRHDSINFVNI